MKPRPPHRRRAGQTLIYLLMICVILALVVLWNFDLHKVISVKLRAQTAGDAAALAAARWQGIALNLIGQLNVLQAVAIHEGIARGQTEFPEAELLGELAARMCYVGPVTALAASQLAAKNNRIFNNPEFTALLASHAEQVVQEYPNQFPIQPWTNAPSPPTAWDNYGTMLRVLAAQGIAAWPDNALYYVDFRGDHLLLNPSFYDAIASSDWCWFWHHAYSTLRSYMSWREWDPLPLVRDPIPINSEYFGLGLTKVSALDDLPMLGAPSSRAVLQVLELYAERPLTSAVARVSAQWYAYDPVRWRPWTSIIPADFPFRGTVKPEYDYVGADASVRVETRSDRATPGAAPRWITWTAAAKPFGTLEDGQRPNRYGLVLPAFREVRLIPVDTASGGGGGSRPGWSTHIREHLPEYVARGLDGLTPGCWYCDQLRTWEQLSFRQVGIEWLERNSDRCRVHGGGPGRGGSGGTRRGH